MISREASALVLVLSFAGQIGCDTVDVLKRARQDRDYAEAVRLEKEEIERAAAEYRKEAAAAKETLDRKLATATNEQDVAAARAQFEAAMKAAETRRVRFTGPHHHARRAPAVGATQPATR